jgi:cytochrome c oxidase subunit 4
MTTAQPSLKTYFIIYALLMLALVATVAIAFVHLGVWNLSAALAIAFFKATIVVLFFMHVKYSPRLTWIVVSGGLVWFAILLALTIADYDSRSWLPERPYTAQPAELQDLEPPRTSQTPGYKAEPAAEAL